MRPICSLGLCCVFALQSFALTAQEPRPAKRILLLHESGSSAPFRGKFDVAFASAIRPIGSAPFDLYEESIDTRRFTGDEQSRNLTDYLKSRYADRKI